MTENRVFILFLDEKNVPPMAMTALCQMVSLNHVASMIFQYASIVPFFTSVVADVRTAVEGVSAEIGIWLQKVSANPRSLRLF